MSYKSLCKTPLKPLIVKQGGEGGSTLSPEPTSVSSEGSRELGSSGFLSASYQLSPTQVSQSHSFPLRAFIFT